MPKDKKPKINEESKLLVRKIISRTKDANGNTIIRTKWFLVEDELNLGYASEKQNEDIVEYKYDVPNPDSKNIFKGLFK